MSNEINSNQMETYFRTQEETIEAAQYARDENSNTHLKNGSIQCECGESFACYLIDSDTLNILETFVYCEACTNNYN